jgi:hypothetical protein
MPWRQLYTPLLRKRCQLQALLHEVSTISAMCTLQMQRALSAIPCVCWPHYARLAEMFGKFAAHST